VSSCPYLSPHSSICNHRSHTHLPSQFPCLPASCPPWLGCPTSSHRYVPHPQYLSTPPYAVLTAAPLFQPKTAMSLTGGEYPLPLACLHIHSPSLTARIITIIATPSQRRRSHDPVPPNHLSARQQHMHNMTRRLHFLCGFIQICKSILSLPQFCVAYPTLPMLSS